MATKLIFVYNANSGVVNGVTDVLHKIVSPSTYSCSLCNMTHGVFSEKQEWIKFRETANVEMEFLHKDEFLKLYAGTEYQFPVILRVSDGGFKEIVTADELSEMGSLEGLILRLKGFLV